MSVTVHSICMVSFRYLSARLSVCLHGVASHYLVVVEASDLPLRNVVFGITLMFLVIHFVVVSRGPFTKLSRSPATSVINSPWSVAAKRIALVTGTLHSTLWS